MNNKIFIEVEGKNINRFLKRLNENKIEIYKVKIISDSKMIILVNYNDLTKIEKLKTIYQLTINDESCKNKVFQNIKKNLILIILIIVNFMFVNFFSNYLMKIEIVDNDLELKQFVLKELEKNGIKELEKKKDKTEIDKIKKKILDDNKDKIEWLEIVEFGVKYIIKVEERIKNPKESENNPCNIIATKEGIIKKIIASNGQVVVNNNDYVKKGDVLISGIIKLNEEEKNRVKASGDVYAETWYRVTSEQSFHDYLNLMTNNSKRGLKINFFNKTYKFYEDYMNYVIKEKKIFKNNILPIYISYDYIFEKTYKDNILTYDEALNKALEKARNKINERLDKQEKIISEKQLKVELKDSKIIVDVLFTVYEKISIEERIGVENVS